MIAGRIAPSASSRCAVAKWSRASVCFSFGVIVVIVDRRSAWKWQHPQEGAVVIGDRCSRRKFFG